MLYIYIYITSIYIYIYIYRCYIYIYIYIYMYNIGHGSLVGVVKPRTSCCGAGKDSQNKLHISRTLILHHNTY